MWDEKIKVSVKKIWSKKAAEYYRGMLGKWQKNKPKYIPDDIWNSWKSHWEIEEFKAKSKKCSKNRLSETSGPGAGPSRHTGGFIPHIAHTKRLKAKLQRPPHPHEVLEVTHTRKKDKQFVDQRSRNTFEAVVSKVQIQSQAEKGSSQPRSVDATQIYLEEVGGVKKQREYGLGSQASLFFDNSSTCSSSVTSRLQEQGGKNIDARIQEILEQQMRELEIQYQQELQQQQQLIPKKLQQQLQ